MLCTFYLFWRTNTFLILQTKKGSWSYSPPYFNINMDNLKCKVHHILAQASHHNIFHESTLVRNSLLKALASCLERAGSRRDGNYWDILTVAKLYHVSIRVMEEHLLHLDSFILYQSRNILHPHIFQPHFH